MKCNRNMLPSLYSDAKRGKFVCRAVMEELSEVGAQVVMRLIASGGAFPVKGKAGVQDWPRDKSGLGLLLRDLHKWNMIQATADGSVIHLTTEFKQGLQASILELDSVPWTELTDKQLEVLYSQEKKHYATVTPEDLERYTQAQWDAVLHFLVGTPNFEEPPKAIISFLMQTKLMQPDPDYRGPNIDDAPLCITQSGYDFMLQDSAEQVWHFCWQYLQTLQQQKKASELLQEAMLFLISLSFAKVGQAYTENSLSKRGRGLMKDLSLFGLLLRKTVGETTYFYPTRVALQLVQGSSQTSQTALWSLSTKALSEALSHPRPHDSSHLAIIVQTNFQLCAYTTSELHVSMLGLFCDVNTIRRLPNVVFMVITRDSVKYAFSLGIQAKQMLRFLEKHAHPKLRANGGSPIPQNVEDQIQLWDRERRRVIFQQVWMHQCMKVGEFEKTKEYCDKHKCLAWSNAAKNSILVNYDMAEQVQTFVRHWRAQQEGM
jgi:transcription initiation factor TFIIH subunit 4